MIVCHPIKFTLILKCFKRVHVYKRIVSGITFKAIASETDPVGMTKFCEQLLAILYTYIAINKFIHYSYLNG